MYGQGRYWLDFNCFWFWATLDVNGELELSSTTTESIFGV